MKLIIIALLISYLNLMGCGGRQAHPVMVKQYRDEKKSCEVIEQELTFIEEEITRLFPQTDKTGKNVALGAAGIFFVIPWFFMDLSKAEQVEIDAYRKRYNHLLILANEKECGMKKEEIPEFNKSN